MNQIDKQIIENMSSGTSEEEFQAIMDQKKRKRKQSNRDSARRSRMRKKQHLDELMDQASKLRKENGEILSTLNIIAHQYLGVEAENSILRTQALELSTRLQSLNEILNFTNLNDISINPWNLGFMNQPIMPSMNMFQYC